MHVISNATCISVLNENCLFVFGKKVNKLDDLKFSIKIHELIVRVKEPRVFNNKRLPLHAPHKKLHLLNFHSDRL